MDTSENLLTHEEIWDDSTLVNAWDEALNEYKKYHSIDATGENKAKILREAEEAEMQDAPSMNQEVIEYQPSIEDIEDDAMEHEEAAAPHIKVEVEVETAGQQNQGNHEQVSDTITKSTDAEQLPTSATTTTTTAQEKSATAQEQDTAAQELSAAAQAQSEAHARIQSHLDAQAALQSAPPPFPMKFPGDIKGQVADKVRHVDNEALRNLMMSWYFAGYYTGLYEGQQQAQQQQNGGQQS
ncbi:hypothetical protein P167DRAFT_579688 [Morchella conica CCBAS932]|uniref:Survival Motor Neuron Gemin2-binding domain-containing protein n=1 Tax=Morchella conica CCBAS932 TaxID=1392247 RepID=A0A3N4K926_9PEZI|nr:hypothetical protein P167DRAFT_579688 [Morchella conica CCBAS932]